MCAVGSYKTVIVIYFKDIHQHKDHVFLANEQEVLAVTFIHHECVTVCLIDVKLLQRMQVGMHLHNCLAFIVKTICKLLTYKIVKVLFFW